MDATKFDTASLPQTRKAIYFSLLSAFRIAWRDINLGNWLVRIQRREYTLRARLGVQGQS